MMTLLVYKDICGKLLIVSNPARVLHFYSTCILYFITLRK